MVYCIGFRTFGLGFEVWGFGFGDWGLAYKVWGFGFGVCVSVRELVYASVAVRGRCFVCERWCESVCTRVCVCARTAV